MNTWAVSFDMQKVLEMMHEARELFLQGANTGCITPRDSGTSKIQAQLFNEMVAIDRPQALASMRYWAEFLQRVCSRD